MVKKVVTMKTSVVSTIVLTSMYAAFVAVLHTKEDEFKEMEPPSTSIGVNTILEICKDRNKGNTNECIVKLRTITSTISNLVYNKEVKKEVCTTYEACLDSIWRLYDEWNMYSDALEVRTVLHKLRTQLYKQKGMTEAEVCDDSMLLWKKGNRSESLDMLSNHVGTNTSPKMYLLLATFARDLGNTELALDIYSDIGNDVIEIWSKELSVEKENGVGIAVAKRSEAERLAILLCKELGVPPKTRKKRTTSDVIAELSASVGGNR